jgi:hypothetical protein
MVVFAQKSCGIFQLNLFPKVNELAIHPSGADNPLPVPSQIDYLRPIVVLEAVINYVPPPCFARPIGLFINNEAASAPVGTEGIVFSHDYLVLAIAIEVVYGHGVGGT